MSVYEYTDPQKRAESAEAAVAAVREGKLIVLPTDTVYGIGADAFNADAVKALLEAKGRGRDVPPPVLIGDSSVLHALGVDFPPILEDLVDEYWPGALTVIVKAQPSLMWDLGETRGTVALRMPRHEGTLDLLKQTGPLAVSSANKHGRDAATTVMDAAVQLGDSVEVYLDGGASELATPSTIIDATVSPLEILREGAISKEEIENKFGRIFDPEVEEIPDAEGAGAQGESDFAQAQDTRNDQVPAAATALADEAPVGPETAPNTAPAEDPKA